MSEKLTNNPTVNSPVTEPVKPKRQRKSPTKSTKDTSLSPTPKLITVESLLEQAKSVDDYTLHILNKKTNEAVQYNEVFSETKIEQLVQELFNHMKQDIEKGLGFFINYQVIITYVNFLIIKYFTNLNTVLSDSLEENIIVIEQLRKINYFKVLFSEVFDNEQVIRVYESVHEGFDNFIKLSSMKESQLKELAEVLQTPTLKSQAVEQLKAYKN